MIWIAKNLEEPIRGLLTLAAIMAALVIIPWVTDIESFILTRFDGGTWVYGLLHIGSIALVMVVCVAIGYYAAKLITLPLRLLAVWDEGREQARIREMRS